MIPTQKKKEDEKTSPFSKLTISSQNLMSHGSAVYFCICHLQLDEIILICDLIVCSWKEQLTSIKKVSS